MSADTSKQKSNQPDRRMRLCAPFAAALLGLILSTPALATLNQNCIVSVLNRTVQVKEDGTWTHTTQVTPPDYPRFNGINLLSSGRILYLPQACLL